MKNAETESWNAEQLRNNRRKHTALICISCKRDGFTPTDRETYPCDACKKRRPRGMFAAKQINHWKTAEKNKAQYILICVECGEKEKDVVARLSCKDARICKCKQPQNHSDRCPVFPGTHSGWNKGVTLSELRSLRYREKFVKKYNIR